VTHIAQDRGGTRRRPRAQWLPRGPMGVSRSSFALPLSSPVDINPILRLLGQLLQVQRWSLSGTTSLGQGRFPPLVLFARLEAAT
jgi:hypothetical protein